MHPVASHVDDHDIVERFGTRDSRSRAGSSVVDRYDRRRSRRRPRRDERRRRRWVSTIVILMPTSFEWRRFLNTRRFRREDRTGRRDTIYPGTRWMRGVRERSVVDRWSVDA